MFNQSSRTWSRQRQQAHRTLRIYTTRPSGQSSLPTHQAHAVSITTPCSEFGFDRLVRRKQRLAKELWLPQTLIHERGSNKRHCGSWCENFKTGASLAQRLNNRNDANKATWTLKRDPLVHKLPAPTSLPYGWDRLACGGPGSNIHVKTWFTGGTRPPGHTALFGSGDKIFNDRHQASTIFPPLRSEPVLTRQTT